MKKVILLLCFYIFIMFLLSRPFFIPIVLLLLLYTIYLIDFFIMYPFIFYLLLSISIILLFYYIYQQLFGSIYISSLYIHPIKSLRGIKLNKKYLSYEFNRLGFLYDRNWILIDSKTKKFITAREEPQLIKINVELNEKEGKLILTDTRIQNLQPLHISLTPPKDVKPDKIFIWGQEILGLNYGIEASKWFTKVLNETRLDPSENLKRTVELYSIVNINDHEREMDPKYDWRSEKNNNSNSNSNSNPTNENEPLNVTAAYSDGFPFLLASEKSLNQLNKWTQKNNNTFIHMRSFRPNIIINGGYFTLKPFDEDYYRTIQIGDEKDNNKFWVTKPCKRCILTTVDPATGKRRANGEPLNTLREYRKIVNNCSELNDGVFFGQNLIHQQLKGTIHIGDKVKIIEYKTTTHEFAPKYKQQKE